MIAHVILFFFFFNDTATTEIYTLSLHDALPIFEATGRELIERRIRIRRSFLVGREFQDAFPNAHLAVNRYRRSEEHTSELQSPCNLVCRLLLEKKNRHNVLQTLNIQTLNTHTLI